jgi:hypothetical protein
MNGGYRSSYEHDIRILTRREPLGVVGCITPWNVPLALTCSKVAPGLAAGNCIMHKQASDTPLTALALAQVALYRIWTHSVFLTRSESWMLKESIPAFLFRHRTIVGIVCLTGPLAAILTMLGL